MTDCTPTSHRALEIGRAAEHLVVADLILNGYRAFLTEQGLPYDVVVDVDGRLLRLQVKSTLLPRNVNSQGRTRRMAYTWSVRLRGKGGAQRLTDEQCDIVALVALDIRRVAYLPLAFVGSTIQIAPMGDTPGRHLTWDRTVVEYPFEEAITVGSVYGRGPLETCLHGHALTEDNLYVYQDGKQRLCKACVLEKSRARKQST